MCKKPRQTAVKPLEDHILSVRHLIEQPQDSVHGDLFGGGQFAQRAITRQQRPCARLREGERESVRHGQSNVLSIDNGGTPQFDVRKFLDTQPKGDQPLSKIPLQFSSIKQIGHGELVRQQEHLIEKPCPFEVDDDRGVRDEDSHASGCHLIQAAVEFTHRNAQKLRSAGLSDHAFGQGPKA